MTESNPYAAPAAEPAPKKRRRDQRLTLASRGARLGAAILDTLVFALPAIVVVFLGTSLMEFAQGNVTGVVLAVAVIGYGGVLLVNLVLLARNGQTIGKLMTGIKIVRADGAAAGLFQTVVLRTFVIAALSFLLTYAVTGAFLPEPGTENENIGGLVYLVDTLLIFQPNKRCLHDYIAGTIVVRA